MIVTTVNDLIKMLQNIDGEMPISSVKMISGQTAQIYGLKEESKRVEHMNICEKTHFYRGGEACKMVELVFRIVTE